MSVSEKEITFASCEGCELGKIIIGSDWVYAHEAVESLSSVYPVDEQGNLTEITPNQLEEIRRTEIQEWREEGEIGNGVADFLEKTPSIVRANYDCDRRRQLGQCALRPPVEKIV